MDMLNKAELTVLRAMPVCIALDSKSAAAVVVLCEGLVERGLIERSITPESNGAWFHITDAGRAALRESSSPPPEGGGGGAGGG